MAKRNRPRFSDMSLTSLRTYAKDTLGLTGLSKAPRGVVMAAINAATRPKPMDNVRRTFNYTFGGRRPSGRITARQDRRIRKHNRKAMG